MQKRSRKNLKSTMFAAAVVGVGSIAVSSNAQSLSPTVSQVAGQPTLLIGSFDLAPLGYVEEEFFISGEASSYLPSAPFASDGRWQVKADGRAQYRTRVVVLRPQDPKRFNGTAIVEWLNVSGGLDAPADWMMAHREILRSGYAYVGVSAQRVGIEGGPSLGADMSLKKTNPGRYASLTHPGDAFAFDIYSQTGKLVKARSSELLGSLKPHHVIAAGESQSASFMTTYVNAVDPVAKVYDGFFIHSRSAGSAPIDGTSMLSGAHTSHPASVKFRDDLRVPVLTLITETDLAGGGRPGYQISRQPEGRNLRVWEVPGTAHADVYTVQVSYIDDGRTPIETIAAAYKPTAELMGVKLQHSINFAPQHHYLVEAGLSQLEKWVRTSKAPEISPRIDLIEGAQPAIAVDMNGIAKGGIRTPWVDVPIARTSGGGNAGSPFARLFGSGEMFDTALLAKLYPGGKAQYLKAFTASLDSAIGRGFILAADRPEILSLADHLYPEGL